MADWLQGGTQWKGNRESRSIHCVQKAEQGNSTREQGARDQREHPNLHLHDPPQLTQKYALVRLAP